MDNKMVEAAARSVRSLTIDAVQTANSGHPGMPMGIAELGALLFGEILHYNPSEPLWANRDRLVLSAGHGSMFLYSLLHLSGFDISLSDIKQFRQVGSKTPGHPEYGHTEGVECTTGPLGQGLCNAVGFAIAERMLAARFNTKEHTVINHYTYAIAGDGCLMEGVTGEASSLAGHLGLGKLIVFYDSNGISIEGSTDLAFTESVSARYQAYGWQVVHGSAYDIDKIRVLVEESQKNTTQPSLIILDSVIGKGSPNKAGTHGVHGAPLGEEEAQLAKESLEIPEESLFYIDPDAQAFFSHRKKELISKHMQWQQLFQEWGSHNPGLLAQWKESFTDRYKELIKDIGWPQYTVGDMVATRAASGKALQAASRLLLNIVGGSADLAPSNNTAMPDFGDFTRNDPAGRTIHFGVREHGMAAISNGMALHGGLRPFCATFFVFTDYLRPSLRLSAMMQIPVIYIMTHDSIYIGEDGPTHQPVEHLAVCRAIPQMRVLRPADAEEVNMAWKMALQHDGPSMIVLTRQALPVLKKADVNWRTTVEKGAYILQDSDAPQLVIIATGSEVSMAVKAAEQCNARIRIISMISREMFMQQSDAFQDTLLPAGLPVLVVEAGSRLGWEALAGENIYSIDRFGLSGPGNKAAEHLGFTVSNLVKQIEKIIQ